MSDLPRPTRAIRQLVERAVREFSLIEPGDRVAVGVSGGKDSLLLVACLAELSQREDRPFTFEAVHLDQRQPGFDHAGLHAAMAALGVPLTVVERDTWSVVKARLEPGQIPCALCSRMRRGILNRWCAERGFSRLALGHHLDDAVETLLMNVFDSRKLEPLKPATPDRDGAVTTIRPLILVEERRIQAWVADVALAPVDCPVCDAWPRSRRRDIKALLGGLDQLGTDSREAIREALYGEGRPAADTGWLQPLAQRDAPPASRRA
jgi:tRNA 2-thiocytidine biosynthesis protein TtcA